MRRYKLVDLEKKLSMLREHREEMGRCTDSSFEKCGSLENWLLAIIFVTGAVDLAYCSRLR